MGGLRVTKFHHGAPSVSIMEVAPTNYVANAVWEFRHHNLGTPADKLEVC